MRQCAGWVLGALTIFSLIAPIAPGARALADDFAVSPRDCVIDPIEIPQPGDVGDLATPSPTPTPIAAADGTPADEVTVNIVTKRIELAIACQNAGDVLRMLANFTERWVNERFSGYDLVFYSRFLEDVEHSKPLPEDQQIGLRSVDEVVVLADGSVIATVTTRVLEQDHASLVVFVEDSGAWLIDGGAFEPVTNSQ